MSKRKAESDAVHRWSVETEVIERNSIRCDSCDEEIESTHRHDFKACGCGRVMVDGGKAYRRRCWQGDGGPTYTDTSVYEVFREEYADLEVLSRTFLRRVDPSTSPEQGSA